MNEDADVNELIEAALDKLLTEQLQRHVPDDERVGITGGWIGYSVPGAIYADVQHRLPQLTQPMADGHLEATLGRHGGIRVTNRIGGEIVSVGVWIDGTYEAHEASADS